MIDYFTTILTNVAVFGVIAIGLDVQWGWGGLLDLSYITFVAAGAYAYALATLPAPGQGLHGSYLIGLHLPFVIGMVAGALVAVALALVVGTIALRRIRPEYFAIVTLSVGLVIFQLVSQEYGLVNGQEGLFALPSPLLAASWHGSLVGPQLYLLWSLVWLLLAYVAARHVHDSPFGRTIRAVRDGEDAASSFGYDAFGLKLRAFAVGAAFAGVGGALLAGYLTSYGTGAWTPSETFLLYVIVLIGGKGRPLGVVFGVLLITGVLQEVTRFIPDIPGHPEAVAALRLIAIGVLMVLLLRWRPQGILPERPSRDAALGPARPSTPAQTVGSHTAGTDHAA